MNVIFTLPAGYAERDMEFVLTRERKGWKFCGRADGYAVPARNEKGALLCDGVTFATKSEAALMARALDLPPYAIWNGRKRAYDGSGAIIHATPRKD